MIQAKQRKEGMQRNINTFWRIFGKIVAITIGAVLMALALEGFLLPNSMMDGGITGISIILSHITGIQLPIYLALLNLPFLFFGYKMIGKKFAILALYGIVVLSISTNLLHDITPFSNEKLLAMMFGGGLLGAGIGVVIRFGGALDGSEILAVVITKKLSISVGDFVLYFNLFVFTIGGFIFTSEAAMFSVLTFLIASKVIDAVVDGMSEMKAVHIISDHNEQIGQAIISHFDRGVTFLNGKGAYTGDQKDVIYCVISRLEEGKIKDLIDEIDPKALVVFSPVGEVKGGRFKMNGAH